MVEFETIKSEQNDNYSDDSMFNIISWGADLSIRELISMYDEDELVKPELQRKYVWDKKMASRFIESLLLGLPVPSIFLAQAGGQKLIVDGYQRIMTVYDYTRGIWSGDNKPFRLYNSEIINERWRNKQFVELSVEDQRRIRSTTIHAIIFEQKRPENDDTSMFQIFERINTSGKSLAAQEIRNCVYQGTFNRLLFELNDNCNWRELFGSTEPDSRMRDLECILRFFALRETEALITEKKQISLKKTLNNYMSFYKDAEEEQLLKLGNEFLYTIEETRRILGPNAFRNYTNNKFSKLFHPAIFDAVTIGVYKCLEEGVKLQPFSKERHIEMLCNPDFQKAVSQRTTDVANINMRINTVKSYCKER